MRLEMNEIRGFLYLGSVRAEAVPIEALREVGITHVVQVGGSLGFLQDAASAITYFRVCFSALRL